MLGFFLESQAKEMGPEWSCIASAELIIKSHKKDVQDFSKKISHNFNQSANDWGYHDFHAFEVERSIE